MLSPCWIISSYRTPNVRPGDCVQVRPRSTSPTSNSPSVLLESSESSSCVRRYPTEPSSASFGSWALGRGSSQYSGIAADAVTLSVSVFSAMNRSGVTARPAQADEQAPAPLPREIVQPGEVGERVDLVLEVAADRRGRRRDLLESQVLDAD